MKRTAVTIGFAFLCGCSSGEPTAATGGSNAGGSTDEVETAPPADPRRAGRADAAPPAPPESPFGPEVRSLELKRSIAVRVAPRERADKYGTVAAWTRVAWKRVDANEDCAERWIEIEPFGWICEVYLRRSKLLPHGVEVPILERESVVPGEYGKITAETATVFELQDDALLESRELTGSVMVRRYGELTIEEIEYWRIDKRKPEYIAAPDIRAFRPSQWSGTRLADDTGLSLPIGFPLSRRNVSHSVPVYSAATGGRAVGKVRGRTPLAVLEIAEDATGEATAYRVGEGRWVRRRELRLARKSAPPPLTGPTERWFDIDLDEQVLVAYEGELPVYATLVATGSRKHPTETGIYRIWIKFSETDMSDLAGESPYSVATVPWTQFYAKDLALHTAYWHDTFGTSRSHGCTNLAPIDARFLYFWSDPQVPPGWSMANGTVDHPGSVVRIRSKDDPHPEFKGYAVRVLEARRSRADAG